jgi:arsenate reductase
MAEGLVNAFELRNAAFDWVVTVCDDAAENCPVWLGKGRRAHRGFPDPARASGSAQEIIQAFREVRDRMRAQVLDYLRTWDKESRR